MIDDKVIDPLTSQKSKYIVFSCAKCGKWTYAKANQKSRKCGICQKMHMIATIPEYEFAETVSKAAQLAQQKNLLWQATQGINIQKLNKPTVIDSKKKSKQSTFGQTAPEENQNHKYAEFLRKIQINIQETHLPQPVPTGYLALLYEMVAGDYPSFARFLRYALNSGQIQGDNIFGFSFQ